MTRFQKYAVFHLSVTFAAAFAVGVLFLATGNVEAALGGFSLLALVGFGEFYWRRVGRLPLEDERDEQIARQAGTVAYVVFWVCFVLWGTGLTLSFAESGEVPIVYVAPAVWVAAWLVIAVRSVAILTINARGA